jgi:hypothetical protein
MNKNKINKKDCITTLFVIIYSIYDIKYFNNNDFKSHEIIEFILISLIIFQMYC